MKVLIIDEMHESILPLLNENGFQADYRPTIQRDEILSIVSDYEGIVVRSKISFDELFFEKADKLKFITSSLCTRVGTKTLPRLTGELISGEQWLVFPWETLDSIPVQDYLVDPK